MNHDRSYCHAGVRGFTLIEMSIVLVVIGLVVGGIFVGNTLIEQARLRQQTAQLTELHSSINTFYTKYSYLPGDLPDASTYLSGAAGSGNGDGIVISLSMAGGAWPPWRSDAEICYFFNHLALAKLVDGQHRGYVSGNWPGGFGYGNVINERKLFEDLFLRASIGDNNYIFPFSGNMNISDAATYNWDRLLNKPFLFYQIGEFAALNSSEIGPRNSISPNLLGQFDAKIDDGLPNDGYIRARGGVAQGTNCHNNSSCRTVYPPNTSCATDDTSKTATYVSSGAAACTILVNTRIQ